MMADQKAAITTAATALLIIGLLGSGANPPFSDAHKPLGSENNNNNNFGSATEIPDPQVSWAIYQQLEEGNIQDYYRFDAEKGERLYVQMTIPDIEKYHEFAPSIAIIGKDMHDAKLDIAANSIARAENANAFDRDFAPILDAEAIILDYYNDNNGSAVSSSSDKFFEPFTQTSYLVRQEVVINDLPSTGVYGLVVFNEAQDNIEKREGGNGNGGKYVLAVGETEDFSAIDYLTTLPAAWFQTKLYFEDYVSIMLAIMAILGVLSVPAVLLVWRKKLRRNHALSSGPDNQ